MEIEIINTGSELMLGRVLNTHQQWLCSQLANCGYIVTRQTVADSGIQIQNAVRESLSRANLIITTGGLGPTSDDITRDLIAELLGKKLFQDASTLARIEQFFAGRKRRMPESTKVQAMVPEGAIVLPNHHGTAPGLAISVAQNWLIMLPGPPRELRPMFREQVLPLIQKTFPLDQNFICRTFRTTGLGESFVEEKIAPPLRALVERGLDLGYCARVGEVDVRLAAHGNDAGKIVADAEQIVRAEIGVHIFGEEDDSLENAVVNLLRAKKKTLALAESCTGGYIAHRITNVSGASEIFLSGLVTYSNEAKERLLGVRAETVSQHGAVSEATVREMAEGARMRNKTDYAIAVTGIAGPTGGSESKPVGTVFIALASREKTIVLQHRNDYDRETFKFVTSQQALELLRQAIL